MKTSLTLATIALSVPLAGMAADVPLPDVSNLTATAMLGWYAWHTASRTIPDLVANFRAELAAERDNHRATIECFCHELQERTRYPRHAPPGADHRTRKTVIQVSSREGDREMLGMMEMKTKNGFCIPVITFIPTSPSLRLRDSAVRTIH